MARRKSHAAQARLNGGLFRIFSIFKRSEAEVRPLLDAAKGVTKFQSPVFIGIRQEPRQFLIVPRVENSEVIQNLFRKVLPHVVESLARKDFANCSGITLFGITDLEIRDDQAGMMHPKSLTLYRERISPRELTGEEDLSEYVIDRKSRAYYEALKKKRASKRSSVPEVGENGRPVRRPPVTGEDGKVERGASWWSVVGALAAVVLGFSWVVWRRMNPGGGEGG